MKCFKMGGGEFLRDYRRDVKWQKTESQKKSTDQVAKGDLKNDQIKMCDIERDSTPGKKQTHSLLKTMLVKHPRILPDTRLYTNKDIELVICAYGSSKKGNKAALADKLVELINSNDEMVDTSVFV